MTRRRTSVEGDARPESYGSEHWYTPAPLVAAMAHGLTIPPAAPGIDLDPFSSALANRTVGAARYIDAEEDGLRADWRGAKRVGTNPPFGTGIIDLALEAIAQHCRQHCASALVVVPSSTDVQWYHTYVAGVAGASLALEGRVAFLRPVAGYDGQLEQVDNNNKASLIVPFGGTIGHRLSMLRRVQASLGGGIISTHDAPPNTEARRRPHANALAARRGQQLLELTA